MKKVFVLAFAMIMIAMLAIAVSAEVSVTYDLEEVTTTAGPAYRIVGKLTDTEGDFRAWKNDITFDYNMIKPVNKTTGALIDIATSTTNKTPLDRFSYYSENEGDTVTASWTPAVKWTANGAESKLVYEIYITPDGAIANNSVVFGMTFVFADGYTVDDLTSTSFVIDYAQYANGKNNYYNSTDSEKNNIVFVNTAVPEATVITIPVTAGDIVYLQDGTKVNIAETNAAYEVPATVGYVAVNTGITAQKTYYVDGTKATLVHENGVLATDKNNLRDRTETFGGEDRSGLRFAEMGHNPLSRNVSGHEVTEVGVLMTTESDKVLAAIGSADNLTFDMVGTFVKSGYAYGEGYDRFVDSTNDELYLFSAVMYNIPLNEKNVQTNIVCRPYYKVGDTYIYGETMKATLYDIATKLLNSEDYEYLSDGQKAYVQEIIDCVNTGTDIEEGDIIIDIGGLYTPK